MAGYELSLHLPASSKKNTTKATKSGTMQRRMPDLDTDHAARMKPCNGIRIGR